MASEDGATGPAPHADGNGAATASATTSATTSGEAARAMPSLERLEQKAAELAKELLGPAAEDTKVKVRENPLVSLLVALSLGFLLGLLFGGLGRGRR